MKHWLMKAEPNSRIEKGKDVKFSVDDFESVKTTPWEGVRNHEAKKLMQSMKIGDQVLFYHSNCKNPGVAGFAEVSKEAYPDYTAWDPEHPYYDAKSDKESPKWFMVDLTFKARTKHFVPLSLFKRIAGAAGDEPSEDVAYIGKEGVTAIKGMVLVNRGRLSVQPVGEDAWSTVVQLAEGGGWSDDAPATISNTGKGKKVKSAVANSVDIPDRPKAKGRAPRKKKISSADKGEDEDNEEGPDEESEKGEEQRQKKRKVADVDGNENNVDASMLRRSTRSKR